MDNNLLVVRIGINLKPQYFNNLVENIAFQKTTGTVVLPSYCEALVVPKDIEVKVENTAKKSKGYNPVEKAYKRLLEIHNGEWIDVTKASELIEEAIGYLGEALE